MPLPDDAPSTSPLNQPAGPSEDPHAEAAQTTAPKKKREKNEESKIEKAARKKFGLRQWDRPTLYLETADAATDTDLPFWSVLLLSGAIATLGLALDATAVVIGAMLIAPLLGPVLGLGLALAVGDGRLALLTSATIALGTIGVIALSALLTLVLPFQTVTGEILARTRPTTLDLAIAVASGLAGAVVTLAREHRLSASIPGVAIAVALIPPLGVAGFAIGAGGPWSMLRGSLLLFGANLAGIVLSAMLAFLLVGMHREDVRQVARRWRPEDIEQRTLAFLFKRMHLLSRARVFESAWGRVALVLLFCVALGIPLTTSLQQIVRENRVGGAVEAATERLQAERRLFVLDRNVVFGEDRAQVRLRIATTQWVGDQERDRFETIATERAGEPISLVLEQVPASAGDLEALAEMIPSRAGPRPEGGGAEEAGRVPAQLGIVRERLAAALDALVLPDSAEAAGAELAIGEGPPRLVVAYAAPRPLPAEAEAMLARQVVRALTLPEADVTLEPVLTAPRPLPDAAEAAALAQLGQRFPGLRFDAVADSAALEQLRAAFERAGLPPDHLRTIFSAEGARLTVRVAPDSSRTPQAR